MGELGGGWQKPLLFLIRKSSNVLSIFTKNPTFLKDPLKDSKDIIQEQSLQFSERTILANFTETNVHFSLHLVFPFQELHLCLRRI